MKLFLKTKNRTISISTSKAKVLQNKGYDIVDESGKKAKKLADPKDPETK